MYRRGWINGLQQQRINALHRSGNTRIVSLSTNCGPVIRSRLTSYIFIIPVDPQTNRCRKIEQCKGFKRRRPIFIGSAQLREHVRSSLSIIGLEGVGKYGMENHFRPCAHRQGPQRLRQRPSDRFQDVHTAADDKFRHMWFVLCSVC